MVLPFNPALRITITSIPQGTGKECPCDIEDCSQHATKAVRMPFLRQWRLPRFLKLKVCDAHARWLSSINAEIGNRSDVGADNPR